LFENKEMSKKYNKVDRSKNKLLSIEIKKCVFKCMSFIFNYFLDVSLPNQMNTTTEDVSES